MIPSVSWGNESTFDFCFSGIEKGSAVAVSTYMVSAHNNHSDQKAFFLKGYNELLRRIEPSTILCYNEPFPEMAGNIVFVDYDLSSWRHLHDDKAYEVKNMSNNIIIIPPEYNYNFESISDFKWCMRCNGEVEFVWNEKTYDIVHPIDGILITEARKPETEKLCNDADEVLEYLIDGVRLREIITEVKVVARTI